MHQARFLLLARVMNASLYSLDRITHFKIVAVALIAAVAVFIVGKTAQIGGSGTGAAVSAPYESPAPPVPMTPLAPRADA